jgi:hypothetical protein
MIAFERSQLSRVVETRVPLIMFVRNFYCRKYEESEHFREDRCGKQLFSMSPRKYVYMYRYFSLNLIMQQVKMLIF